ncbi:translation initiation factor IF-2 N-terminal domain-containing protein, partial [Myxococcus sp. K15C18031901]|uniref:translation initiation factor IF-2 N-terminal domain-containing protein n=1 Tax=Myxococcus dinghuensis TaxID=2906761 RepID=UPI0020A751FE
MSKKRVHEIAKELKGHGIELDNKEVVTELSALGYDVKSHSSSLDDDQATAAVQKILDKRKPKQAAPPVTAKGFVVRRKVGSPSTGASSEAGQESMGNDQVDTSVSDQSFVAEPSAAAVAETPRAPEPPVEAAPRAPEPSPVAEPPPAPEPPPAVAAPVA